MPKRRVDTDLLDKRRRAVELRNAGATYQKIAEELGYATHVGARKAGQVVDVSQPIGLDAHDDRWSPGS